ncbi:Phage tail sheath protein [Paenibacillus sophorae]|uniref:Phage tail sheath family protein n=1 Tax=Paenibacillus sophorae TaxID=1333845 RepID=A0A1H8VVG0_9BACL|nr:phage tail sheath family protein [Paenibacillus sophorae]QWU15645.1 phage tail sheath family protein [Paenibacillus sophorae]SEP19381.1 Phage tail sheath protein [Paenibacillus sophorae]
MAGGTWTTQNKVRPGVYVNVSSQSGTIGKMGERGTAALALALSWGPAGEIIGITPQEDIAKLLGYDWTHEALLPVREALKRAGKLLLYRLNTGVKAEATASGLKTTAQYGGERGNDLSVVIASNIEDPAKFDVKTLLEGAEVDRQTVAAAADLLDNDYVTFEANGPEGLQASAGIPLTGGSNGTVTNQNHSDFLAALEVQDFQTVGLVSQDNSLKALYTSYVKRLRDSEGKKVQVVVSDYATAGYEGVISVKNGVILSDGTVVDKTNAVAWTAGATAAAAVNESLTYQAYDDAVDVDVRLSHSETTAALLNGELLFTYNGAKAVVEQDINTLTAFTPARDKAFSKNRVLRVLDGIAVDLKRIFETYFVGKVSNNEDGRALFWSQCAAYMNDLQDIGAIENFNAQTDISVVAGVDSDSVVLETAVKPVDSVEKVYLKVKVV